MDDTDSEVVKLLKAILDWIKVTSVPQVRAIIESEFPKGEGKVDGCFQDEDVKKNALIYYLADGKRKQTEIARLTGVSQPSISTKYKKWEKMGLLRVIDKYSLALFDLNDFGYKLSLPRPDAEDGWIKASEVKCTIDHETPSAEDQH